MRSTTYNALTKRRVGYPLERWVKIGVVVVAVLSVGWFATRGRPESETSAPTKPAGVYCAALAKGADPEGAMLEQFDGKRNRPTAEDARAMVLASCARQLDRNESLRSYLSAYGVDANVRA